MRKNFRFIPVISAVAISAALVACAPMPTSSPVATYPASSYPAGTAYPTQNAYVEYGRVSNVELLNTQAPARTSGLGAVLGGVAGAVVGNQIGGGTGKDIATVAGAVGGAVAGNSIERSRNNNAPVTQSYRVSVQLDNGTGRAFEVPTSGDLRIGDRVRIENGVLYRI